MALIQQLQSVALNPYLTAPIPLALAYGPENLRDAVLRLLGKLVNEARRETLVKALKWLAIFGVVAKVNARLNDWALSNFRWFADKKSWDFKKEVAVITGGCSGIGKETVKLLMRNGVRVAIFDIQPLPKDLEGYANLALIYCDVTQPSSIADAALKLRVKWGDPSILINNAGIGQRNPIIEAPPEVVTKIFQVNILSHFWLMKEFLPAMLEKNKGHVVGLASMASFVAPPGVVHYAATKAAVMALHEGLNGEIRHIYKKPGVLNTIVHPSWTRTPLVGGYESHLEKTQGKLLSPENIAKQIVDQILSCRGGQLIMPAHLRTAPSIRGHANWLQEIIRDVAVGGAAATVPDVPASK